MQIPKEKKCKFCGARILFVPGVKVPVESGYTPYTRHPASGGCSDVLFTAEGGRLDCRILRPERDNEIEGYAHRPHLCRTAAPREPSERERRREEYREFRRSQ